LRYAKKEIEKKSDKIQKIETQERKKGKKLTYHQNKLKQAQNDLLKSQNEKKAGQITGQRCMRPWR